MDFLIVIECLCEQSTVDVEMVSVQYVMMITWFQVTCSLCHQGSLTKSDSLG